MSINGAAAAPVVAQLADDLSGTEFGVIVADRGARLIEIRSAQHRLITDLEEHGIAVGRRFAEETTGNNSVGTAYELRAGVVVRGEEHFLEALRGYVCYGHPVINPLTRRVEGVISVVSLAPGDNPLLAPYIGSGCSRLRADGVAAGCGAVPCGGSTGTCPVRRWR